MFIFIIEMSGLQKKLSGSISKNKAQEKFEEKPHVINKNKKISVYFQILFGYQK